MPEARRDGPDDSLPEELADALFGRLLAVGADQQPAVLDELCRRHPGHAAELRAQARQMLAADRLLGTGAAPPPDEDPAEIASLRVQRRLGEGAFGVVYLCEQQAPIRRQVAVKVLRPGAGNRHTLLRFQAERQVLARMNHPAIAHVIDAGVLGDGRPYFVMEYVDGAPVTEWCDRHRLTVEQRLDLVLRLCDGVQHAHHKGVIHRDLKPSNVLVVDLHGRPQPKIIDFGLAKALHQDLPQGVAVTEAGGVLGTPGFMSPEQAEGRAADVDTRADVFALGVILYVVLTGAMPWPQGSATGAAEPLRPSSRLSGDAARAVAAQRAVEPRRLVARIRGDLDWIVLKALDRDRERRYQSVLELADDLRRHMRHEPVRAGPPSAVYQLQKFCRRHRVQVAAAAAVLLSLLLGLAVAWRFAVVAQRNLDRFEILALGRRLDNARAAAAGLQPPWPERLPAFDDWLEHLGRPLQQELPRLRAALENLRAQALPLDPAERAQALQSDPLTAEIDKHEATIAYAEALLATPLLRSGNLAEGARNLREVAGRMRAELPGLERQRAEHRPWRFASSGQQFLHDTMSQLERDLAAFCDGPGSLLARVVQTRDRIVAEDVQARAQYRQAWQRAAGEVRAEPRYRGLQLRPQAGLLPLGRDPVSGLQEFYHPRSAPASTPVPARDAAGRLVQAPEAGIVFVLLPGGRTAIGAQAEDPHAPGYDAGASLAEGPVHEVELAPFLLAKYEVTQFQWQTLANETPSNFHSMTVTTEGRAITGRHPVENVTWDEAASVLAGQGFELPTEAQWEYACRAGSATTWPTGDRVASLRGFANLADASALGTVSADVEQVLDDGFSIHAPVGSFAPNGFGLHDMVGNVSEWCRDNFSSLAYLLPPRPGDGLEPVPEMRVRPVRGGSFEDLARQGASAARHPTPHNQRGRALGVRAARRLQQ